MSQQHILQVSELTKKVRFILESELNTVWLTGEISNFVAASSGHWYLSLKDKNSQVRCAMFKGSNRRVRLSPSNGLQVLVRAKVSLYEPRGDFQLIIEQMEPAGEGLLRQQYQALKTQLHSEGLFAAHLKKPIPRSIKSVGIITSATGAAVKDILTVLARRNPLLTTIIYPVLVQGELAKEDISQAIELANIRQEVDVLIVGRGGGSLEDLWAFNEEMVARAIFTSQLPIISAVGHEVDTTLADYVADLRAPTPSAAAELVSTDISENRAKLTQLQRQLIARIDSVIKQNKSQSQALDHRLALVHPEQQLRNQQQKSDELLQRLQRVMARELNRFKQQPNDLLRRLIQTSPINKVAQFSEKQSQLSHRLVTAQQRLLTQKGEKFIHLCEQLNLVSPLATIARGYSVTRNKQEKIVHHIADVNVGEVITVEVNDGVIEASVITTQSIP